MVYFRTDKECIVPGAEFLKVQLREVLDTEDDGSEGELLAEAIYIMFPLMGSVLGGPIIEVHHKGLPEELLEGLHTAAEKEAKEWRTASA